MQAYYLSTVFAFLVIFFNSPSNPDQLALMAIGFQMSVEVARHFNTAVRWTVQLENEMICVQRLLKYVNLEPEDSSSGSSVSAYRDIKGHIEFKNVEFKYKPEFKPALTNLSFTISEGERVAVVGRTGAGKSSLF